MTTRSISPVRVQYTFEYDTWPYDRFHINVINQTLKVSFDKKNEDQTLTKQRHEQIGAALEYVQIEHFGKGIYFINLKHSIDIVCCV